MDVVEENLQKVKISTDLSTILTKMRVFLSVSAHAKNIDPVSTHAYTVHQYLIKEGVISSFDASPVGFSTNMYFHNRLYVVSRQLPTFDDPDPDLNHGRKF